MDLQNGISVWIDNPCYGLLKFLYTCLLDKIAEKEYFFKNLRNVEFSTKCLAVFHFIKQNLEVAVK